MQEREQKAIGKIIVLFQKGKDWEIICPLSLPLVGRVGGTAIIG